MKKHISKSAMLLSAILLFGAASAPSLSEVFAQDSDVVDEISEEISDPVDDAASDINEAVTGEEAETNSDNHSHMEHDNEGRLPGNIKIERDPTYKVGDSVQINANHMPGMEGAEGRIVAAFDTVAYAITYNSTVDDELVEDHRWIVHEEITEAQEQADTPFEVGDEITVEAYHMPGMEGVTATITEVSETTVYLVDYIDTQSGEEVINHKWVTEEELASLDDATESSAEEETSSQPGESESSSSEESESTSEDSSGEESESTSDEESDPEESDEESESSEESSGEESEPSEE